MKNRDWENLSPTGLRMTIKQCMNDLVNMYHRSDRFTTEEAYNFQQLNEELTEMRRRLAELESIDQTTNYNYIYNFSEHWAEDNRGLPAGLEGGRVDAMDINRFSDAAITLVNVGESAEQASKAMGEFGDAARDAGNQIEKLNEIMKSSSPVHDEVQRRMEVMKKKQEEWSEEAFAKKFQRKRRYHKDQDD